MDIRLMNAVAQEGEKPEELAEVDMDSPSLEEKDGHVPKRHSDVASKQVTDKAPFDETPNEVPSDGAKPTTPESNGEYAVQSMLATSYSSVAGVNSSAIVSSSDEELTDGADGTQGNEGTNKRNSWSEHRKSKTKDKDSKKPLKKLPPEIKAAIQAMEAPNVENESEIPTVIKLNNVTNPPNQLRHPMESPLGPLVRDISFSDSISTISHHEESSWMEQGMSSLLNKIRSEEALLSSGDPVTGKSGCKRTRTSSFGSTEPTIESPAEEKRSDPSEKVNKKPMPGKTQAKLSIGIDGNLLTSSDDKGSVSNSEPGAEMSSLLGSMDSLAGSEASETFEGTVGSYSTFKDGHWLEIGLLQMLDVPLSIALANDHHDDLFDKKARRGGKGANNGFSASGGVKSMAKVETGSKTQVETKKRPSKSAADANTLGDKGGWLEQEMSSIMALVSLMSQQDEENAERKEKLDRDSSNRYQKLSKERQNDELAPDTKHSESSSDSVDGVTYVKPEASSPRTKQARHSPRRAELSPGPKPREPGTARLSAERDKKDEGNIENEIAADYEVDAHAQSVWKTAFDPKSGRAYYFHRHTRQTTWTKPDEFEDEQSSELAYAVQMKRSHSPRKDTSESDGKVDDVAEDMQPIGPPRSASSNEHIDGASRSNSTTISRHEMDARKPRGGLVSCTGGRAGVEIFEGSVQVPFDETTETSLSTNDDSSEIDILASELLAEVEKEIDLSPATVTNDKDDNNIIVADEGFERVLSSKSKMPIVPKYMPSTMLSSVPGRVDEEEDVLEKDSTLVVAGASKGYTAMEKNEKNRDSGSSNESPGRKDKAHGVDLPSRTATNRRGMLRRFKSLSKKFGKGHSTVATVARSNDAPIETPTDEASSEKSPSASKLDVFVEIDTERPLLVAKGKSTKSGRGGKKASKSKAGSRTKLDEQGALSRDKRSGSVTPTRKSSLPKEKGSPSSVLHIVNVDDEAIVNKPNHRPFWKAVVDASSGRTYYYHRITRETTWTKPKDPVEPVKPKKVAEESGDFERESLRCNLDDKVVPADTETSSIERLRSKQKETSGSKLIRVLSRTNRSKNDKIRGSAVAKDESNATKVESKTAIVECKPTTTVESQPTTVETEATTSTKPTIDSMYSESTKEFDEPPSTELSFTDIDVVGTVQETVGTMKETVVESQAKASSLVQNELDKVTQLLEQAKGSVDEVANSAFRGVDTSIVDTDVSSIISDGNKSKETLVMPDTEAPADEVTGILISKEGMKLKESVWGDLLLM